MKLSKLRLHNFRCFGPDSTQISLRKTTFLLGPNGSGKTAILQALTRMFGFDRNMRRVHKADFHIPHGTDMSQGLAYPLTLWVEADFDFPELKVVGDKHPTIPANFAHMRLETIDGVPRVRFRLDAALHSDGEIEERLSYVSELDDNGEPLKTSEVPKHERNSIQVHYLPARRDPNDQISYAASSLLGRVFRSANWSKESQEIASLTKQISTSLGTNEAVTSINEVIGASWKRLHSGNYYEKPEVSFGQGEIDGLLKHLTLSFSPGHEDQTVDFSRLGDGQKSLLYVSLVLSVQELGRQLFKGKAKGWDITKLQPAIFSFIAIEEPENSLSPHHLGRVIRCLTEFAQHHDAQAIVATHSPSLLKRVPPEHIRYLRLNAERESVVKRIPLPPKEDDAHKFVREAVQAYPELYFSRLVVLGEGDTEEILLPKLFQARGVDADATAISVVPLGGRHVNHFWRLLSGLEIPFVTLLDLDLARFNGGWGRIKYAATELLAYGANVTFSVADVNLIPKWNQGAPVLTDKTGVNWIKTLENYGVFFSSPLDIDFAMLDQFRTEYAVKDDELEDSDKDTLKAVLGKKHAGESQYSPEQLRLFGAYHTRFKLGSKPATHLSALTKLTDPALEAYMPPSISRMFDMVEKIMGEYEE